MQQRQTYDAAGILLASLPGEEMRYRRPLCVIDLDHKPLFIHGVDSLLASERLREVIVVMHRYWIVPAVDMVDQWRLKAVHHLLPGEDSELATLKRGMTAVHKAYHVVTVLDGSRPLPDESSVAQVTDAACEKGVAVLVRPLEGDEEPVDQDRVLTLNGQRCALQSPAAFRRDLLVSLLEAASPGITTLDGFIESLIGGETPVEWVTGEWDNPRVIVPEDLDRCTARLRQIAARRRQGR